MVSGSRRHSVCHQEGSSTELMKEDVGGNEDFSEVYFYKINDIIDSSREYKLQRLILDRINQTENFIKMN